MEAAERQVVIDGLASSEARLLALVDGLTPAQWNFHETPERWSIAENIEHVIAVENRIRGAIAKVLTGPPDPDKRQHAAAKDPLTLAVSDSSNGKLTAPEPVRPVGKWPDTAELIAELRKARAQTTAFATEIQGDLRNHFFPHMALGDLDCYQWLVVLSRHGHRHAKQIEGIKANPAYPA